MGVALRFDRERLTESEQSTLKLEFTRSPELIFRYKALREALYKTDPRFVGFRIFYGNEAENYEDADDQMLILHDGEHCYGGACLRISTPAQPVILDLEKDILPPAGKDYFFLKEHLPELGLNGQLYAEFNRIVLHPSLRKGQATRRMFRAVLDYSIQQEVRYMFGIGDKVRIRLYRQIYHNMGLDVQDRPDIHIPLREEYEGVSMHLLQGDLKSLL